MSTTPSTGPRSALAAYLEERGIKQVWLAGKTGIDPSDISRMANGMTPGRERAHAVAEALGTTCTVLGWAEHDSGQVAA